MNRKSLKTLKGSTLVVVFAIAFSTLSTSISSATYTAALSVNSVSISGATVSSTPVILPVPSDNSIDATDALKVSLSGMAVGSVVSVTTNGAFLVPTLASSINVVRSTDGQSSINSNIGTGTTFEFFAFVRSTNLSSITVSVSGVSNTYFLRGISGPSYNLEVEIPSTGYLSTISSIPLKVTDVFGNPVAGVSPVISTINLVSTSPTSTNSEGRTSFSLTYPGTTGRSAISISIPAIAISGLPLPKNSYSQFIDVVDLASALKKEQEDRLKERNSLVAQIDDLKKSIDSLTAEKTSLESAKKVADETSAKALSSLNSLQAEIAKERLASQGELRKLSDQVASLQRNYRSLVAKYNKLAKKFRQPTIRN